MNLLDPREPFNCWSHGLWLVLAVAGLALLWQCGRGNRARQTCLLIYGVSLTFCSACSTLYHGVRLPAESIRTFALWDHIGIVMLIAGTYTPIAWTFLQGHWRRAVLGSVWLWAALGIAIRLTHGTLPGWQSTGFYLGMGWGSIFCYFEIARRLSHRVMMPILAGGILYSIGAMVNLLHRPILWPGVVQWHELFHLFVVAASLCHFYFILTVVGGSELDPQLEPVPAMAVTGPHFAAQPVSGQVGG